jgi:hypothetical protein
MGNDISRLNDGLLNATTILNEISQIPSTNSNHWTMDFVSGTLSLSFHDSVYSNWEKIKWYENNNNVKWVPKRKWLLYFHFNVPL